MRKPNYYPNDPNGQRDVEMEMIRFQANYETAVYQAFELSAWWHWFFGCIGVFLSLLIADPQAVLQMDTTSLVAGAFFIGFMGLMGGWISFVGLIRLMPWPYAWLARKLGLAQQEQQPDAPDVTFSYNPLHKHPAVVVRGGSESV